MPNEDFLDQLPAQSSPRASEDDEMDQVVKATANPGSRPLVRKLVRRLRPVAPAIPRAVLPAETETSPTITSPEPEAETEPELATLPTPVSQAPTKPVPPPAPTRTVPRPAPVIPATLEMLTAEPAVGSAQIGNRRWDEFLTSLGQATLIAVWELNVTSLADFTTYSLEDLIKPRGRLTRPQAIEVRDKLAACGVQLSATSRGNFQRGSVRQATGIRSLRGDNGPPPPADASSQQRRQHRLSNNRLTM